MLGYFLIALSHSESSDLITTSLNYIYDDDSKTASVKCPTEPSIKNLVIPSYVEYNGENYTVDSIGDICFYDFPIYGTITFPPTLVSIGSSSFYSAIKDNIEIVIPDSVTEIKSYAFSQTKIVSLSFGKGIKSIGDGAFSDCSYLKSEIKFPDSLGTVGPYAFCDSPIIGVKGGINIESFGECCFENTDISCIDFPTGLEEISDYLFSGSKLEGAIRLPNAVSRIGEWSFAETRISDIVFPSLLGEIGPYAFMKCANLSTVINIDSLETIGKFAFCYSGIEGIQKLCCNNIYESAFAFCTKLKGTVTISNNIGTESERGNDIFQGCTSIKSINIVSTKIPENFAEGCASLESVKITLYNKEQYEELKLEFPDGIEEIDEFIENLTQRQTFEICDNAFSMCSSLKSIDYPSTLKRIGKKAFFCCESYTGTLPLNNYPNLTEIDDEAFLGCKSLVGELVFPDSLITIGNKAFIECKFAGSIFIPDSVETIGDYAFFGCSEFSGILSIGNGCISIGESVFSHCTGFLGSIHIGNNISSIGARAFFGCSSLTGNLEIPASVKTIGDSAFTNCIKLSGALILHKGLESIGVSAFTECTGFSGTLTIPSTVTSIGSMAFFKCTGFDDVYFESNNVEVGFMAFSRMHNKCFSNVPNDFDDTKFDSDNMAGSVLPESSLNMHCAAFRAIDGILVAVITVCCSGGFAVIAQFVWNWLKSRSSNIKKLIIVVKEIIANVRKNESEDENEAAKKIINKIRDRLTRETKYSKFSTTKDQAEKAVTEAIDEEWPTILPEIKDDILLQSLDEVKFYKRRTRCSKINNEERSDDDLNIIDV